MNGPTAAKRPRVEPRPATPTTTTAGSPYTPSPIPTAGASAPTPKTYAASPPATNAAVGATLNNTGLLPPTPTASTPWANAAQNPITLDPALAAMPSPTAGRTIPNPTASYSRFLPQQQYPTGLPPTSPALSYPSASASSPIPPTSATTSHPHHPSTPTALPTTQYSYFPNSHGTQLTSAGFARTIPPATANYTPHYQNVTPYTPSTSYLPSTAPSTNNTASGQPNPTAQAQAQAAPPPNPLDSSDPNELNDILGSAGVDVKAEQDALNRTRDFYQGQNLAAAPRADRARKQAFIDTNILAPTIRSIASSHNIPTVPPESLSYLSLALRTRLLSLITSSVDSRAHRNATSSAVTRPPGLWSDGTPMWAHTVKKDLRKQLGAIERVEREEEARIRRERHERLENPNGVASSSSTAPANDADEGSKKRKRPPKEMGPGVTAKTMPEDVRKKLVDDVASRSVGGGGKKYAWMTASASSTPSVPKPGAPLPPSVPAPSTTPGAPGQPYRPQAGGGGWMRATPGTVRKAQGPGGDGDDEEKRTLMLVDVEFAIEREKGHGGGRGGARGW